MVILEVSQKKNRLDQIRSRLATVPECSNDSPIFAKKFCIYKYVYVPWGKTEDVTQIGVGLIENVHGNPSSTDARFDIRFCPPKGAKPQQGSKRPDTLYQNIAADMAFNKSYSSKKGKRIENEDTMLDRGVMLAFNWTLNKDGTFTQKKKMGNI